MKINQHLNDLVIDLANVLAEHPMEALRVTFKDIGLEVDNERGWSSDAKIIDVLDRNFNVIYGDTQFQMRPLSLKVRNNTITIYGIDYAPMELVISTIFRLYLTIHIPAVRKAIEDKIPNITNIQGLKDYVIVYEQSADIRSNVFVYAENETRDKLLEKIETFVLAIDNGAIEVTDINGEKEDVWITTRQWINDEPDYAESPFLLGTGYIAVSLMPNKYAKDVINRLSRESEETGELGPQSLLQFNHMIDILPFVGIEGQPKFITTKTITVTPKMFRLDSTGVTIQDCDLDQLDHIDIDDERILIGFNSEYFDNPSLSNLKYYNFNVPKVSIKNSTVLNKSLDKDFHDADIRTQIMVLKNILSIGKAGAKSNLPLLHLLALELALWFNVNMDIDIDVELTNPINGLIGEERLKAYKSQRYLPIMNDVMDHVDLSEKATGLTGINKELLDVVLRSDIMLPAIIPDFPGLADTLRNPNINTDDISISILSCYVGVILDKKVSFSITNRTTFNNFVAGVLTGDTLMDIATKVNIKK